MKKSVRVCLGIGVITLGIGIIAVVIAAGLGGMKRADAADTIVFTDNVSEVHSLEFDFPYGDVEIIEGNDFNVTIDNAAENDFTSKVVDGVWIIKGKNNNKRISIFNIEIPVISINDMNWGIGGDYNPKITITIPEYMGSDNVMSQNAGFKNVHVSTGAGRLSIDYLSGKVIYLEAGAGDIQVNTLNSIENVEFNIGAGSIKVEEGYVDKLSINCGVGELKFNGIIYGRCDISSGVGSVDMKLDNEYENCYFNVDTGIGSVKIKNNNVKSGSIGSTTSDTKFYIDCGIGDINISFK